MSFKYAIWIIFFCLCLKTQRRDYLHCTVLTLFTCSGNKMFILTTDDVAKTKLRSMVLALMDSKRTISERIGNLKEDLLVCLILDRENS